MSTRTDLLALYLTSRAGTVVRPDDTWAGQSPDLANDYLRYLTGEKTLTVPGHAIEWAISSESLTDSAAALLTVADYTSAFPGRRAPVALPAPGDLMVFSGPAGNPYGALGIYLAHTRTGVTVFTQGDADGKLLPAQIVTAAAARVTPLGWWRVHDHELTRPAPWALNPIKETTP